MNTTLYPQAMRMLAMCTAFWALSFPAMKALSLTQQKMAPETSVWFITALSVFYRFVLAGICLVPWVLRARPWLTRSELNQGLLIGLIGGVGVVLQMDGLSYTDASTSAFLTQFYCAIIPVWMAWKHRQLPSRRVVLCVVLVLAGVAILSGFDWRKMSFRRGELETLLASVIFTGQILWLGHPGFAGNRTLPFSMVMFFTMALTALPVAVAASPGAPAWVGLYAHRGALTSLAVLVFLSALGGYLLMNHWQKHVPATHAGMIYCLEPVFASAFALFLPGWFSEFAGIEYSNEKPGWRLVAGGVLITLANAGLQWGSGENRNKEGPRG
ncbi:MAG: DMT family transporter [Verrucomicrobia bacterium]|nr:DMT family transporter [Verrucomicrobiota bacterium]